MAIAPQSPSPEHHAAREARAKSLLALSLETEPEPAASPCQPIRELARGGMGVVWDARDPKLQRNVAMKVMRQPEATPAERHRFMQEGRVLGQLAHPNIVPIYDLGTDPDGRPFYTMKLVQGSTLQEILERLRAADPESVASYPLPALLTILQKVCDAMSFAHSRGVIHRDLKPQNVMVGEFGEVLVMDWGLAKLSVHTTHTQDPDPPQPVQSPHAPEPQPASPSQDPGAAGASDSSYSTFAPEKTLEGTVMGTPHYMAPEQAAGRQDAVDHLADVFSLGGILYAMLTLHPPVQGTTREDVLANARQGEILPPVQRASGSTSTPMQASGRNPSNALPPAQPLAHLPGRRVPPALAAVAMRALAADRRQRYPSVAAFSRDLAAYQDGFPTEAEQAGTLRQIQLLVRRHRVAAAALAILLVLTAGFIARLVISERRAERNAEAANLARTSAETSAEAARKALAQAQISLAEVAYRELDSRTMIRALESVPPSYRDGDWNYLRRQADNSQAILSAGPGHFYIGAAAHPQEPGIFALISTEPALHLVDVRTGLRRGQIQLSPRHAGIQIFRSLGFSPDGKRLIVGGLTGGGGVAIYDIDTGSPTVEWDSPGTDLVQFGPDGSLALEINSPHQQLSLRDTTTGRLLWSRERCSMAVFATRDRMLIASGEQLMLLQAATGALLQTFPSAHAPVFRLVLSPDSTAVYYTTPNDMFVRGQRLDDGELIFERPLTDAAGRWASVALSRDGTQVLGAITDDDHKTIIRVWDRSTGTQIRTLRGHHCPLESLATHPRSEDIVATGTESRSWSLASHPPDWELPQSTWGGRFLGNDNLVFSAGGLVRLGEPGHWVPSATPLPEPFSGTLHAGSSAGLGVIGIRGSRSRGISGAEYLLARTTAEGTALTPGRLSGRDKVVIQIQPSPDGRHLAAADDYSGLTIHETTTGRLVSTSDLAATLRSVTAFAWLNPSRLVGIGSTLPRGSEANEERVILWDMPTGETLCHRSHPTAMDCLAPLPGGMEFAEAGVDKLIRIRDATSLAPLRTFRAHDGPVVAMAAHPTRALLATASTDLMIRLWRVPSGELLAEWPQAPSAPMNLVFSPSGDRLAATDHQGRVRIWNLGSGLR